MQVEDVASVLEEGDEIWVKVISVDEDGGMLRKDPIHC